MTKQLIKTLIFLLIAHLSFAQINVEKEFLDAAKQYEGMLAAHPDLTKFPQSTKPDGTPDNRKSDWWCSGFFGGSLWYLYEANQEDKWEKAAHDWTIAVEKEQYNTGTHDLGFMIYCPFGNGYRLTENEAYKPVMLTAAKSLSTRFDPKVGLIKSWNNFQKIYDYPVIIDNMMNLELLFWAAKESGDSEFYDLSVIHADNTLKNHFRVDNSSYHVLCYDENGNVIAKKTHQGAADESAWSRGQAWGLYGYTVMYRETGDPKYLEHAQKIANFMINHPNLPKDKIPYWDFSKPGEERDASAGAITSSALFELADYSKRKLRNQYRSVATQMLTSLTTPAYKAKLGENNNFLLMHSTGHKPGNSEVNTPIVYADYYFLEALHRYKNLTK
ncbi:MAG: unsaturated chondroitin disaccharide hydrolase [Oceanospirillaceae bacterium]|jgi:unsaturated chondroitin disaccharide hydrolase